MVNQQKFLMNEMPWDEFKKIGMTEEAFLDLPKDSIDRILTGNLSPLMKMKFVDTEGNAMKIPASMGLSQNEDGIVPAKFRLQRNADGKINLVLHPKRNEVDLKIGDTQLTAEQLKRMKNGETVLTKVSKSGKDEKCYVQLDHDLNVVHMAREKDVVIPNAIGDVVIGTKQAQQIREGKPVELEVGDTKVTVGVDINSRNGFRVVDGDMNLWKQRKLEQWDRLTPGVTGYWRTSENGWEYRLHHSKEEERQTRTQTVEKSTGRTLDEDLKQTISRSQGRGMRR